MRKLLYVATMLAMMPVMANTSLEQWGGQYPQDIASKKMVWQDPLVSKLVERAFSSKAKRTVIKRYTTVTPMSYEDNLLTISGCKPHNCPNGRYTVWINDKTQQLWSLVVYVNHAGEASTVRCYSTEDNLSGLSAEMLNGFQSSFDEMPFNRPNPVKVKKFMHGKACYRR